jgi:O-antigen/teichoic acid export membrane protein
LAGRYPLGGEVAEDSDAGRVFIRSLVRSQLRLALVVACGFLLILAAFALLLAFGPGMAETKVLGIPLDWLLLGAGVYPVVGLSAWLFTRAAARNEARYRDLVEEK